MYLQVGQACSSALDGARIVPETPAGPKNRVHCQRFASFYGVDKLQGGAWTYLDKTDQVHVPSKCHLGWPWQASILRRILYQTPHGPLRLLGIAEKAHGRRHLCLEEGGHAWLAKKALISC